MSFSDNFPNTSPSLLLDFANAKELDPRITFTRTTTATYYDGVTTAKAEENLLLYSQEFDNGTGWAAQRATVSANSTTAPDGTSTADSLIEDNTASDTHRIIDNISGNVAVTGSTEYVFSVFAKANTRDWIALSPSNPGVNNYLTYFDLTNGVVGTSAGGNTGSIESVGNGWYRCIVKRTTASNQTQIDAQIYLATGDGTSSYTGDNTSGLYIWGAQLEQRSAVSSYTPTTTQAITNYIPVLQTAASGVARFDHNPTTNESLGLLVEEQRTNLCLQSGDFSTTWTTTRSSITSNTIVAPDGTLTGDKLVDSTDVGTTHFVSQGGVGTISAGATITFSAYVKAGELTDCSLLINAGVFADRFEGIFNLANGTVRSTNANGTGSVAGATITAVGNGWYRVTVTGVAGPSNTTVAVRIQTADSSGSTNYTGNGYDGIYIWGAQLEEGAFPTSYIATTSASVTRNADAASMTGTNFSSWFNAGEGTVYTDYAFLNATPDNFSTIFEIDDGTSNNRIFARYPNYAGIECQFISSASTQANLSLNFSQAQKIALAYKVNDFAAARTGGIATDTSGTVPNGLTTLSIGDSGTSVYMNGYIRKLAYYPSRLPDAQLQALTS